LMAVVWRRRFPWLLVGWFWYVGMMVPVIGLVQVGSQSMADRYTYLPQIGLVVAVTWGFARLVSSWRDRRGVAIAVSALVVLVLMGLSWRQVSCWRNSETLWTHALECTTANPMAHNNLGVVLSERGEVDEAVSHFRRALEMKPNDIKIHNYLGSLLAQNGEVDQAISLFHRALEIKPDDAETCNNLGIALAGLERVDEAVIYFQKALELKPDNAEIHNNLGIALAKRGRLDEAVAHFRKALEIKPDHKGARDNLDMALGLHRQPD
jgi:Flp pilus assembly protein TadD